MPLPKKVEEVIARIEPVATSTETPQPVRIWLKEIIDDLCQTNDEDTYDPRFVKGEGLPNSIGALADAYAEVREHRLSLDKKAKAVKDRETEIHNVIMSALLESTDTGASGSHHRVERKKKTVRNVEDWEKVWSFVRAENAFEMLGKSINQKAVGEYAETKGELPPGIKEDEIDVLSFTKL